MKQWTSHTTSCMYKQNGGEWKQAISVQYLLTQGPWWAYFGLYLHSKMGRWSFLDSYRLRQYIAPVELLTDPLKSTQQELQIGLKPFNTEGGVVYYEASVSTKQGHSISTPVTTED